MRHRSLCLALAVALAALLAPAPGAAGKVKKNARAAAAAQANKKNRGARKGARATAGKARPRIIATIGPKSSSARTMKRMKRAGMRVARFNLTHYRAPALRKMVKRFRKATGSGKKAVPILMDLPGGKVRTGAMGADDVVLAEGQSFTLHSDYRARTTATSAGLAGTALVELAEPGDQVLLDDGKITLRVTGKNGDGQIETEVVVGGAMRSRMGVAIKGKEPRFDAMTQRDRRKIKVAVDAGADWIGVSMVQRPQNVISVRTALNKLGARHVKVVAKIESLHAISDLSNLEAIMDVSDMVMIARGDLGAAVGADRLPEAQETIARMARDKGVPLIMATNFMSNMVDHREPSTDNLNDIGTAVDQQADWIMLSNETAMGAYPARTVKKTRRAIKRSGR